MSRKKHEIIVIGEGADAVTVTVVEIRSDKVRLGIVADRGIPVHRQEVWEEIQNQRAIVEGVATANGQA